MKLKNKIGWKIATLSLVVVMVVCSVGVYSSRSAEKGAVNRGNENGIISLVSPSFIGVAGASEAMGGSGDTTPRTGTAFLEEEAGISTYTNVGESINLENAKTAFKTIEYETDEYIIGSVPLPDYPETEDVHAYVHVDGWVVTYYLKEEPAAKILDWEDYGTDEKITGTKLEDGIYVVCSAAGVPIGDIKYYDFRYPNADKLMIIVDAVWASTEGWPQTDTFRLKLPSDFTFYERSFLHYCNSSYEPWYPPDEYSVMYINETEVSSIVDKSETCYGLLSATQLPLDEFYTVKTKAYLEGGNDAAFGAIVLIYREA